MKVRIILVLVAVLAAGCSSSDEQLRNRAAELCQYIPDHELVAGSEKFITPDFYAVLDTMFNHLPEYEAMDHEWLYYFVTSNGGTIADYEVDTVERLDKTHAVATILVRQQWEDGSFDEETDIERHQLLMERVQGQWMIADFDDHKADCIRHIAISRREEAEREAVSAYLVREIAPYYVKGDRCIPAIMLVDVEEHGDGTLTLWGDFMVEWYNYAGDSLCFVSGGNHSGRMTLEEKDGGFVVTSFEQTTDGAGFTESAKRIFGERYPIFENVHHVLYERGTRRTKP